ncbi:MAG TPA: hypothetical protein VE842_19585, partial [Pyrinomonadaceae bacterium]|nr:hypothetical protein [Pyrinomonadaceae bacterium]
MKKFLPAIAIVLALGVQLPVVQAQNNDAHASPAGAENGKGATTGDSSAATENNGASEKTDEATEPTAPSSTAAAAAAVTLAPATPNGDNAG